ncbi:LysR family transcriptional regulator [Erwinia sorbitola]|uniref:LysR family transcriptional regulator n=2 Tax=Erwinia sorbitola TaxID=2681984 RepID=A0A6I6EMI9_9GAMM|nr:LysR family transcriptional regulator [Erwinia sorbitola]
MNNLPAGMHSPCGRHAPPCFLAVNGVQRSFTPLPDPPDMLKLKPLHYFKTVVEHGSISAASKVLYTAQPPISKALLQLESHWDVRLFERTPRGMTPTDAGRHLYQRASDLLQLADNIDSEMRTFSEGQRGVVRIGCVDMGIVLLTNAIVALRSERPDLQFSLHQGDPLYLEELLERRQIDAALVHLPLTLNTCDVTSRVLQQLHVRVLCLADGPLAGSSSLSLAELAAHPLVLLRRQRGFGMYERVLSCFNEAGLTPEVVAQASDLPVMKQLVRQGVALALVPSLADALPEAGMLALDVPQLDVAADRLALIYHQQHAESAVLKPLLAFFSEDPSIPSVPGLP